MRTFQGVLFDILDEVIIERSSILRATYSEALDDARRLISYVNADDEREPVDDGYCFVCIDGVLAYSEAEAA